MRRVADGEITGRSPTAPEHVLRSTQMVLRRAQQANVVRSDVGPGELMALLTAACHGALQAGWEHEMRQRMIDIIFDGLRPRLTGDGAGRP